MIKIIQLNGSKVISRPGNVVSATTALEELVLQLANYTVLPCASFGTRWYVGAMSERDKYVELVDRVEESATVISPLRSMRFEAVDGDTEGFRLLFMAAAFYAAATGLRSEAVTDYLPASRALTGLAETGPARLLNAHVPWVQ